MTPYLVFFSLIFYCLPHFAQSKKLVCASKPKAETSKSCPIKKDATKAVADSAKDIKKVCEKSTMSDEFYEVTRHLFEYNQDEGNAEDLQYELDAVIAQIKELKNNIAMINSPANKAQVELGKKIQKAIQDYEDAAEDPVKKSEAKNQYKKLSDIYDKKYENSYYLGDLAEEKESLKEYQAYKKELEEKIKTLKKAKPSKGQKDHATKKAAVEKQVATFLTEIKERKTFTDCGLSDQELLAIMLYTGNHYVAINSALRTKDKEELKRLKPLIDSINSGLRKIANHEGEVKRGAQLPQSIQDKHCMGCEIVYDAYTSTSTGNGFGGNSKFLIQSKGGKYVAPLSSSPNEDEVLFFPGTKFKVTEVDGDEPRVFKMVEK